MKKKMSSSVLILLTLFLPPVGAYFVCTDDCTKQGARVAACLYALAALAAVLIWRPGCGAGVVEAQRLNNIYSLNNNLFYHVFMNK